ARTLAKVCRVCSRRVGPTGVGAWPSTAGPNPTCPATCRMFPFFTPCENFAGGVVWVAGVRAVFFDGSLIGALSSSVAVLRAAGAGARRSGSGRPGGGRPGVLRGDRLGGAPDLREQGEESVRAHHDVGRGQRHRRGDAPVRAADRRRDAVDGLLMATEVGGPPLLAHLRQFGQE